ncbi:CHAT domain-containing protein [Aspergillus spectabilis]
MADSGREQHARAMEFWDRYHTLWETDDIDCAIEAAQLSVEMTPLNHEDRAARCSNLASMLADRFQQKEILEDINEAIKFASYSVAATPEGHYYRATFLYNLGVQFGMRYDHLEELSDLNQAIENAHLAIKSAADEDPNQLNYLDSLATNLARRSTLDRNEASRKDAEQSVELGKVVADCVPDGDHESRPIFLANLGKHFLCLYDQDPEEEFLAKAIDWTTQAVLAFDTTHPMSAQCKNNLGIALERRFDLCGKREDLLAAIGYAREVLDAADDDDPKLAVYLNALAVKVSHVYDCLGHIEDLEEAISLTKRALEIAPRRHPDRADWNNNLGNLLAALFKRTGKLSYIRESVQAGTLAVNLISPKSPDHASYLTNLSNSLETHFEATGDLRLLEDALEWAEQAVNATPETDARRSTYLMGLGTKFARRHNMTADIKDLEQAVKYARDALRLVPENHREYPLYLTNLAFALRIQYQRLNDITIAEEAVNHSRKAISMTEQDHQDYAAWLLNLSHIWSARYDYGGENSALDEAIRLQSKALELSNGGHIDYEVSMSNLAASLSKRFIRDKINGDLERSIDLTRRVLELLLEDHPNWPGCAQNMAIALLRRYERKGDTSDRDSALRYLVHVGRIPQTAPMDRIIAVRAAIRILHSMKEWHRANELAAEALKLLPLVCGRFLGFRDQQYVLSQLSGFAADASSLALKNGDIAEAIVRLEFGRGLMLSYMFDSRHHLSDLRASHPELADKYETLLGKASRNIEPRDGPVRQTLLKERREALKEFETLVHTIRSETPHNRFLLGPTIEELQEASQSGPIILVNVTDISSDAMIIVGKEIKHVELPSLLEKAAPPAFEKEAKIYRQLSRGEYSRDIQSEEEARLGSKSAHLEWLWKHVVKLILNALGYVAQSTDSVLPRVWWIGTGIASTFPFHAAGASITDSTQNALGYMIPSYAHSIKALLYARSKVLRPERHPKHGLSLLVVTMPRTPAQADLPGAVIEANAIKQACEEVYKVEILSHPSAEQVLGRLAAVDIVHFACHAHADSADPSMSHLMFRKPGDHGFEVDRLSLGDMAGVVVQGQAQIAFLSACSTAQVKAQKLADEGLHLANTFQACGFRHVIGALWAADDGASSLAAETFYTHLVKNRGDAEFTGAVSSSLRRALLQVRSEYPESPEIWAPFIHYGL